MPQSKKPLTANKLLKFLLEMSNYYDLDRVTITIKENENSDVITAVDCYEDLFDSETNSFLESICIECNNVDEVTAFELLEEDEDKFLDNFGSDLM